MFWSQAGHDSSVLSVGRDKSKWVSQLIYSRSITQEDVRIPMEMLTSACLCAKWPRESFIIVHTNTEWRYSKKKRINFSLFDSKLLLKSGCPINLFILILNYFFSISSWEILGALVLEKVSLSIFPSISYTGASALLMKDWLLVGWWDALT